MELWLFLCCCFIFDWGLLLQKYTVSLNIIQKKVSTALYTHQWTHEDKVTKNPVSSVAAETMKLLAIGYYGYLTMDRSRHTVAKK